MRVNVRLDEESPRQIDCRTAATAKAVSPVLRESVSLCYRHVRAQRSGIEHLAALIGKGSSGRSDIASNVERHFAQSLSAKHRAQAVSAPVVACATAGAPRSWCRRPMTAGSRPGRS